MIAELNKHLLWELSAHIRYNGHAQLLRFKGYTKLADRYDVASAEELGHANKIIWRIRELGGMPDYIPKLASAPVKKCDVPAMLESDSAVEQVVMDSLTALINTAEKVSDYETSSVLRHLASETEEDITWYNQQLELIEELGVNNYLQAQL